MNIRIARPLALAALLAAVAVPAHAAQYLVTATGGPGYKSPEEAAQVLEKGIFPTFDALMKLQADKKIVAGGVPVGERALTLIVEASSTDELDRILRGIPAWGVFDWQVTPLQSIQARSAIDHAALEQMKKTMK
jgi:Muconolactone delta-isomerase